MSGDGKKDDALAPDDVVPAAFSAIKPKRTEVSTRDPRSFEAMKDKEVIVHANGVEYRGTLTGTDGEELYLRTELRHVTILLDRVSKVVLAGEKPAPLQRDVMTESFLNADDDEKR